MELSERKLRLHLFGEILEEEKSSEFMRTIKTAVLENRKPGENICSKMQQNCRDNTSDEMEIQILSSFKDDARFVTDLESQTRAGAKIWCATMRTPRMIISESFFDDYPQKSSVGVNSLLFH